METALITQQRENFHRELIRRQILTVSECSKSSTGLIASNGDSGQKFSSTLSHKLAKKIADNIGEQIPPVRRKKDGQTLGNEFEILCQEYINTCFKSMEHLRPGTWLVEHVGGRSEDKISKYAQYSHLAELKRLANQNTNLASFLGNGYTVSPDVIIARIPEPDSVINGKLDLEGNPIILVDNNSASLATLRAANYPDNAVAEILHASISCKFTMRSDRAQNTRTEALNLLRNRKGRSPHIVAVTAEPTPSRISSLALGTGDVDCVYHFALYELRDILERGPWEDAFDQLNIMIEGKRLRDISDLPLDLAV